MASCKCRYCQSNINTKSAHLVMIGKQKAYFCNEEHYNSFELEKAEAKQRKAEELEAARQKKKEAHDRDVEIRKEEKNKVYYLICEIVGRKEIINTVLWKEWAIWNKVADNKHIGKYLEDNKSYLISIISKLDNNEFLRIRYLSAVLKNKLGDFKEKTYETPKPKVQVDETLYVPIAPTTRSKRRSLEDLEDEF